MAFFPAGNNGFHNWPLNTGDVAFPTVAPSLPGWPGEVELRLKFRMTISRCELDLYDCYFIDVEAAGSNSLRVERAEFDPRGSEKSIG